MKKILTGAVLAFALLIPAFSFAQTVPLTDQFETDTVQAECVNLKYNLSHRSRDARTNDEVSLLQDFLISEGYLSSNPTGFFGLMTVSAVKKFQSAVGIGSAGTPGYGNIGPKSRAKIKAMTCGGETTTTIPTAGQTTTTVKTPAASSCDNINDTIGRAVCYSKAVTPTISTPIVSGCTSGAVYSSTTGQKCIASGGDNTGVIPTVSVLSPNGGESLISGQAYLIKWEGKSTGKYSINIEKENGFGAGGVTSSLVSGNQHNWIVGNVYTPSDRGGIWSALGPGKYKVHINEVSTGMGYSDQSDAVFTILVPTVTTPVIISVTPSQGAANDIISIYGNNLSKVSRVEFGSSGQFLNGLTPYFVSSQNVMFKIDGIFAANEAPKYQVRVVTPEGTSNAMNFNLVIPSTLVTGTSPTPTACPQSVTINGTNYTLSPCSINMTMIDGQGDKNFTSSILGTGVYGYSVRGYGVGFPTYGIIPNTSSGGANGNANLSFTFKDSYLTPGTYTGYIPVHIFQGSEGTDNNYLNLNVNLTVN